MSSYYRIYRRIWDGTNYDRMELFCFVESEEVAKDICKNSLFSYDKVEIK